MNDKQKKRLKLLGLNESDFKPNPLNKRVYDLEAKTETEDNTTISDLVEALNIVMGIVLGEEE